MCAYDTTVVETVDPKSSQGSLPICLQRDNLTSKYFPQTSKAMFSAWVVLCVVFLLTSFYPLHHTDLWGHMNFGRWIATNGSLPQSEPFSIEGQASNIVGTSWLAQLVGYLVHSWLGAEGLVLGHVLLVTAGCALTIAAIRRRRVSLGWATAGAAMTYILATPIIGAIRPQLFAMLGVPLTLLATTMIPSKKHPLVWLPILFLLWANLHGSFAIGLVILAATAIQSTWRLRLELNGWKTALRDRRFARIWLALLLAVAGCCVNPAGVKLLLNVATFGGNAALANITEWQPLTVRSLSGMLFFSSLLMTAMLLRFSTRRIEVHEVLLAMLFAAATLTSMRMLIWWALVWPWVVAPHAAAVWNRFRQVGPAASPGTPRDASMRTVLTMGFVFATLLIAPPTHAMICGKPRGTALVLSKQTPIFVADEVQRRGLKGRVFAPMDWADYLVWTNPAAIRPLVYSHVHLMKPAVWNHYAELGSGSAHWLKIVDHYDLNYLVLSRRRHRVLTSRVIAESRSKQPRTRIVYQDQKSMLVEVLDREG